MRIGVFDSGIGGEKVAQVLQKEFPEAELLVVNDKTHLPYGDKSQRKIISLTDNAIQRLINASCDVIVLACNTATAAGIEWLRQKYPDQKFVGLEPMVKTAASLTKTGIVCICATPSTLKSDRYLNLKKKFASSITIVEPDCSKWAKLIEASDMNQSVIANTIEDALRQDADVIVLACTHYHWIEQEIKSVATRAQIIEPSLAIAKRIRTLLELS